MVPKDRTVPEIKATFLSFHSASVKCAVGSTGEAIFLSE